MRCKRLVAAAMFVLLWVAAADAQFQRLGIRPQSIALSKRGASRAVEAFCFDKGLDGPPLGGIPYRHTAAGAAAARVVLSSGKRLPLAEALEQGIISATGAGALDVDSGLRLTFTSNVPEPIRIEFDAPLVLAPEPRPEPISAQALKQLERAKPSPDKIWLAEADAGLLSTLGYDVGRTPAENHAALVEFQRSAGLNDDGLIGNRTREALRHRTKEAVEMLEALGDTNDDMRLDQRIAQLQKEEGVEVTGRYDSRFRSQMEKRGRLIASLKQLAADGDLEPTALAVENRFEDVVTFSRGFLYTDVLVQRDGRFEHWMASDAKAGKVATGAEALQGFSAQTVESAVSVSEPSRSFITTGVGRDGKVLMSLGPGIVEIPSQELRQFATGNRASLPQFDKLLGLIREAGESRPQFVFLHSPIALGRQPQGLELFDAVSLATATQRAYGKDLDVLVGTEIGRAMENAPAIPRVTGGSDVRAVRADGVRYNASIANIAPDLKSAGIRVISANAKDDGVTAGPVTIFMGHKDATYRAAVLKLAQEGAFKDGIFVAASCGEPGEALFNAQLIRSSGARAVIYYEGKINPGVVESVLLEFVNHIPKEGAESAAFRSIWTASVDAVAAAESNFEVRAEVLKLRDVVVQVSEQHAVEEEQYA
jgi:hypothetical protein